MKRSLLLMMMLLTSLGSTTFSQDKQINNDSTDSPDIISLSILSNLNDASIYIDSVLAGKTPLRNYMIKEGSHTLKVINPQISHNWDIENFSSEIILSGTDTTIKIDFETFYYITTDPFNVQVHYNDTLIGLTPLRFYSKEKLVSDILLTKEEYYDSVINLSGYNFSDIINVKLKEKRYGQTAPLVFKNKETNFKTGRDFLAIGSFGAGLILSAYSAIHTKNIANDSYDRYLLSGSQQEYDDSRRYDAYSLVSLIIMEAAIAGLIYFLFID